MRNVEIELKFCYIVIIKLYYDIKIPLISFPIIFFSKNPSQEGFKIGIVIRFKPIFDFLLIITFLKLRFIAFFLSLAIFPSTITLRLVIFPALSGNSIIFVKVPFNESTTCFVTTVIYIYRKTEKKKERK